MSFERLSFTKTWLDPSAFPTMETDENQVRRDMQALHDEGRDALNALMDALEAPAAAASLGMTGPDGATTVQTVLGRYAPYTPARELGGDHTTIPTSKAVSDALTLSGNLPAGGDRGEALIKASGSSYDLTWGQPSYSRSEILDTGTAQRYGLSGGGLPDTVFNRIAASLEQLESRARLELGSYIGSGSCGANYPNSLTFDRPPKLLMLTAVRSGFYNENHLFLGSYADEQYFIMTPDSMTTTYVAGHGLGRDLNGPPYGKKSADGKTLFWYSDNSTPAIQYNTAGQVYHYLVIF